MQTAKNNWNKLMAETLSSFSSKPKLLLHSCCAPCSSYVIKCLAERCDVTVFYYNPNIYPDTEYEKRYKEQKRLLNILDVKHFPSNYLPEEFNNSVIGLQNVPEGGARCTECFRLRLKKTAETAKENGFDIFGTTLTVSPHKNADTINSLSLDIGTELNVAALTADFKKNNGYYQSIQLSKEYGLYRQNYCGCKFSGGGKQ